MKKVLDLLGLCARSRRVRSGEELSAKAVKSGDAKLAFMDEGASDLAKRVFEAICETHGVRLFYIPDGMLGDAIGKPGRMAAVVVDEGFARRMFEIIRRDTKPGGH